MTVIFLIGRVLLGGYFLVNAYNHLMHSTIMTGYAASKGVPSPRTAILVSGLLLLIGGLSILLGVAQNLGLWAIVLFLVPVTFTIHAFWKESEPAVRAAQRVQFMKNLALLGAVLMLAGLGTGWPASF